MSTPTPRIFWVLRAQQLAHGPRTESHLLWTPFIWLSSEQQLSLQKNENIGEVVRNFASDVIATGIAIKRQGRQIVNTC